MYDLVDLRGIKWNTSIHQSGTDGCYLKRKYTKDGIEHYLKLSLFRENYGFVGYESVNEVIAYRLSEVLGLYALKQRLLKVKVTIGGVEYTTYACDSVSYKKRGEQRMSVGDFCHVYGSPKEPVDRVLRRCGFGDFLDMVIVFDFLIIGRDRHGSNIEFLKKDGMVRPAPLYDNGISFLAPITSDISPNRFYNMVKSFEELGEYVGNNYIGSRSLKDNLSLVSRPVKVKKLEKVDKRRIFYNLSEVLPDFYKEKIWSIICYRYSYLRKLGIIMEV